jgi:hypothetical protein
MPFLCLFRRKQIKKYFLKCFRISDYNRNDIAQLFSLSDLTNLFNKDFSLTLFTKFSVDYLLNGGKGLVWSKLHLRLVKFANIFRLGELIKRIANDRAGFINKFFTPTYYLILKKK